MLDRMLLAFTIMLITFTDLQSSHATGKLAGGGFPSAALYNLGRASYGCRQGIDP